MRVVLVGRAPFALQAIAIPARPPPAEPLVLDLSGLEFASPMEVAGLALLAGCVDKPPTVVPPELPQVTGYLTAMGLPAALGVDLGEAPEGRDTGFSIPVRHLTHPDAWDDEAGVLLRVLRDRLGSGLADSVLQILGELADNAGSHGVSAAGYYVAGQFYTGKTSGMVSGMWLAVVDGGIGIREHLRGRAEYRKVRSDHEAIRLAVQPGVTGTYPPRGYGLADVRRFAGRQAPGRVLIRSGRGFGAMYPRPGGGRTARYGSMPTRIPGTWVMVLAGDGD